MGHPLGLVDFIVCEVAQDLVARSGFGPELLRFTTLVIFDDRVRGIEDGLGRAVVLLQQDRRRIGERRLELQDVADVCATEPVDRLVAIADDTYLAVLLGEHRHHGVLHLVGVLILVDEYVLEPALIVLEDIEVIPEQSHRVEQKVVEVHGAGFTKPVLVFGVDLGDLAFEDRGRGFGVRLHGEVIILGSANCRVDRARGELLRVEVEVSQYVAGESNGVGLVVDRERRRKAEAVAIATQDAHTCGVESGDPHLFCHGTNEGTDAKLHFVSGLVGKGDRQNFER